MPYGNLNIKMRDTVASFVKGRTVYDLGAGDGDHGRTLRAIGASRVVCIDKNPVGFDEAGSLPPRPHMTGIECVQGYIDKVPMPNSPDVVFLGWPQNYPIPGLMQWVNAARTVIYLGCNFNGTACGFPDLFHGMMRRELLAYVPDPRNSLIVVGRTRPDPREPTAEEAAALSDAVVYFRE